MEVFVGGDRSVNIRGRGRGGGEPLELTGEQYSPDIGEPAAEKERLGAEPVVFAAEEEDVVGDRAEPAGEAPVRGTEPVQVRTEVLEVALLPHPRPLGGLPVRHLAPEPAVVCRAADGLGRSRHHY